MTYKRCLNPSCRRKLTSEESQERGYGSDCWKARQPQRLGAILRRLPVARRAVEQVAGQLAFDEEAPDGDV